MAIAQGEDCRITTERGEKIYRQVKKREGDKWNPSDGDFRKFVQRAHNRFSADRTVQHEFYTNAPVDRKLMTGKYGGQHLNPNHKWLEQMAGDELDAFCATISIEDQRYRPNPETMENEVCGAIRHEIDVEYPGSHNANDLAPQSRVRDFGHRLLASEFKLLSSAREVSWDDVEAEVGLDQSIRSLETIARGGGAVIPWNDAICDPHGRLPREAALAVIALSTEGAITGPYIEDQALAHVNDWVGGDDVAHRAGKPRPIRLVLLVGPHGSGKTWALMKLGSQLAKEQPDVAVTVAPGPCPDDWREFSKMGLTSSGPQVILVDEIFDDWHNLLLLPRSFFPEHILFLGTASCDMRSYELLTLSEKISDEMEVVPVPGTVKEQEIDGLALVLGRLGASKTEAAEIGRTNIRHAVEILRGREPVPHLAGIQTLLLRHIEVLGTILFCTASDLSLPVSLFERTVGHTLPPELSPWILSLEKDGYIRLAFEDPHEADALLTEVLGEENKGDFANTYYGKLLLNCDPTRKEERVFARHLFARLNNTKPVLVKRLLRNRVTLVTELVRHEPTWALAYCWLPLLGHAELPELLEAATSRLVRPRRHLSLLQGWDIGLLVRAAEMLKQLPRKEQARPARRFCALLMDLPAHTLYQSFLYHDAFTLLVSLLASSGGPRDREKALKVVGGVLRDELREGRSILANWYEAYLTLLDRTFGQGRGGLSIEVTKRLVDGGTFEDIGERYEACRKREHQLSIGPLLDLGLELFARFTTEVAEGAEIGAVPSNVVKLAVTWAEQGDWERLFEQHLACIEAFSFTRAPLDRVAPLVQPSFRVIRRCTQDARRRLLVVLLRWVPQAGVVATEETGKFLLRLLRFIATQPWLDDEVVEGARKVLLNLVLNPEYAYETGRKICAKLTVEMRGSSLDPALSLGFPDEWWRRQGLAHEYLIQTAAFAWSPAERVSLATRIRELWAENRNVWLNLSKALLRLGEYREGSSVAAQMAMTDPKSPDPHGLLAVASARQDNLSVAYKNHLATVVTMWERYHVGLHPWLAVWVHSELAETTRGIDREMHIVCAALAHAGRLPRYNQLRAGDRNAGLIGDGESAP